jgi:group II intron reverse transcriptase/maturase
MRNAETILGIMRQRGQRGLPVTDAYRLLYQRDLYLRAYGKIYRNDGAMTPGVTLETVDGMSLEKIDAIIDALRDERYRWMPVRRTYIPKKNGKRRPLGLPAWSDKLLQEVIRSLLEAYYEPQFSEHSHGFRPGRGCHTALRDVVKRGKATKWFIEGDLCACFDSIDSSVLLSILRERFHDNRFLRLISGLLNAGYLEDWQFNATYSGVPQGGVASPILSNVVLDRLDKYVEKHLIPAYTRGRRRRTNPPYVRLIPIQFTKQI